MKIIQKRFPINTSYPLERIGNPEKILFFDIETTGLSPYTSNLYLIGTVVVAEGAFLLTQFFIESMEEEQQILKEFSRQVEEKEIIIQYNGDTFDVPYLNHCFEQYHLPSPFEGKIQIDLLKHVRRLKKLLNLKDCKLKTAENFLGIHRLDPFTGGDLIAQYHTYVKTKDPSLFRNLILHNEEDLEFLPPILDFLWYEDLKEAACQLVEKAFCEKELTLTCQLSFSLPVAFTSNPGNVLFFFEKDRFSITLPVFTGELKHFYPDYKDYYYLPEEDIVVHKRIAEFMPAGNRRKATKDNCFVRKSGHFIPEIKEAITPSFREDYRSKCCYFEYSDELPEESWNALCLEYLQTLLR